MSSTLDRTRLWYSLAAMEREAATVGGLRWARFVQQCERELGLPWDEIRERFNRIHIAEGR